MSSSRRSAGFSFIEILIVLGIITLLAGTVTTVIPLVREKGNQTKSNSNLKSIATWMLSRSTEGKGWPKANGKNFTLYPVATGQVSEKDERRLGVFFSPGDRNYTMEGIDNSLYAKLTKDSLRQDGGNKILTSYAGRRNSEKDYAITSAREHEGVIIMCDDDDGGAHHPGGLCCAFSDGGAQFMSWEDLGMAEPDDLNELAPFLGDDAEVEKLAGLSSE